MQSLEATVESCVNRVGVDLNTASWALLRYVAGITERTAQKIVEYRNEHGQLPLRASQLTAVPGIGPKTFEQAAGFLRIRGGRESAGHDGRASGIVSGGGEDRASRSATTVEDLIAQPELLEKVEAGGLRDRDGGHVHAQRYSRGASQTRDAIRATSSWRRSGATMSRRSPISSRGWCWKAWSPTSRSFGAFVDIGVHQDGLVHISELSNRYVKDPSEVVKVGTDRQGAGAECGRQGQAYRAFDQGAGCGAA